MNDRNPVKLYGLTDRQKEVIVTMRMRLTTAQALSYLEDVGYQMSESTWRRIKAGLKRNEQQRLHHIAALGFESQHLERIDSCELIEKLMWENYHLCKSPFQRVLILEKIANLQPYISSYYDITRSIMEVRNGRPVDTSKSQNLTI